MIQFLAAFAIVLFVGQPAFAQQDVKNPSKTLPFIGAKHKPKTLEQCLIWLDKMYPDSVRQKIAAETEDAFVANSHFGLGMWIRNNWGLWRGSDLSKHFNSMGIYHPDDMSGIILTSYHRRLNGVGLKIDEQVKEYQRYWKIASRPTKKMFPEGAGNLAFNSSIHYNSKTHGSGAVHFGTVEKSEVVWLYDYDRGWKKVTTADVERIEQAYQNTNNGIVIDNRDSVLSEIYSR